MEKISQKLKFRRDVLYQVEKPKPIEHFKSFQMAILEAPNAVAKKPAHISSVNYFPGILS